MDLPSAGRLAEALLQQHGLAGAGWTFRFNQRKRSLGLCNFTHRRIELSAPFVARNPEAEVRDVLLHEIAHALTPPPPPEDLPSKTQRPRSAGTSAPVSTSQTLRSNSGGTTSGGYRPHGPAWRAMCLKLGANPDRLNTTAAAPPGKWQAVCPGCQTIHHRHRKPARGRSYICKTCGPESGRLRFVSV